MQEITLFTFILLKLLPTYENITSHLFSFTCCFFNYSISRQKTLIAIHHPSTNTIPQIVEENVISPSKKQTSIFFVLKTGGPTYDYRYVNALAQNIRRNSSFNYEIVCITDNHKGIDYVDRVEFIAME